MPEGESADRSADAGIRRRARSRRVVVRDDSMRPTLLPGDRLYVDPRPGRPVRVGDVIVLDDPERSGRLLVKRVVGCEPAAAGDPPGLRLRVEGDNPAASRDSRQFGPVPPSACRGVVWFRYAPGARRGPVPTAPLSDVG